MVTDFLCPHPPLIEFVVPGEAVPFARAGAKGKHRYTLKKQSDHMMLVKAIAWEAMNGNPPIRGPLAMSVHAQFLFPKSWSPKKKITTYWKETKSDTSNIIKIIEDAMNGIVFNDDAQISLLAAQKTYGTVAQTVVKIWSLSDD